MKRPIAIALIAVALVSVCFVSLWFGATGRPVPPTSLRLSRSMTWDAARVDKEADSFEVLGSMPSRQVVIELWRSTIVDVKCRSLTKYPESGRLSRLVFYCEEMTPREGQHLIDDLLMGAKNDRIGNVQAVAERVEAIRSGTLDPCSGAQMALPLLEGIPKVEFTIRCNQRTGKWFVILGLEYE